MTLPGQKGLGYKPDAADERDYKYGAAAAPDLPGELSTAPDLSSYVGRVRDQGSTSSCVGQALAAAIEITSLARDGAPLHASAQWLYTVAREAEGRKTIADDGSFPRLAMQAANLRGVLPERSFPFSAETIEQRPAPSASVSAYDLRGLRFYRVDSYGSERVDALDDALRRGCAVLFGGPVSAQYQHNEGDPIDTMGTSIGGHMQCLVRCGTSPLVLNSWGVLWGDRGYSHWTRDLVAHYPATDIYAVTSVPA